MLYRCPETTLILPATLKEARQIKSLDPNNIEWAASEQPQCLMDSSTVHRYHVTFCRDIPGDSREVFLFWGQERQWIEVMEVCLEKNTPLGTCCTNFKYHPGAHDWGYVDPGTLAAEAWSKFLSKYLEKYGTLPPSVGGGSD